FNSILLDGTLNNIHRVSLTALTSIILKSPEVNLAGIDIGGNDTVKPSLTIISNNVNILNSNLDLSKLTIQTLDQNQKGTLLLSKTKVLFTSISLKMSKTIFGETSLNHRVLNKGRAT